MENSYYDYIGAFRKSQALMDVLSLIYQNLDRNDYEVKAIIEEMLLKMGDNKNVRKQ
jgi:hypothetical protein